MTVRKAALTALLLLASTPLTADGPAPGRFLRVLRLHARDGRLLPLALDLTFDRRWGGIRGQALISGFGDEAIVCTIEPFDPVLTLLDEPRDALYERAAWYRIESRCAGTSIAVTGTMIDVALGNRRILVKTGSNGKTRPMTVVRQTAVTLEFDDLRGGSTPLGWLHFVVD